jgi:predicted RNA-binding protein with TRAM domain
MIEIPEELRSVFTATVRERDGEHVITVPEHEVDHDAVAADETYRIAVFEAPASQSADGSQSAEDAGTDRQQGPPVEEGEVREVTIESVGDQGDGIAKVERGYVVIVPDGRPGQQPTVEIDTVRQNVSFATIVESSPRR